MKLFFLIAAVNIVMLLLSEWLEPLGYRGWAFFLVNVLFFIFPEPDIKARMIKLACGAVVGALLAHMVIRLYIGPLAVLGQFGLIIPIVSSLALLFLLGPILPICFNVCAFAYFTAALVKAEEAYTNVGPTILFALLGVLVVDGGCALLLKRNRNHSH